MSWTSDCTLALKADLYRHDGRQGLKCFVHSFLFAPTFRYVALMRICNLLRQRKLTKWTLYLFFRTWYVSMSVKYGIRIPLSCLVGNGLLIEHWGGIWVSPEAKIGCNCNISQSVTLGWVGQGTNRGAPIIHNQVFLGPGCVVLGQVNVADKALISANTVVLQDVPENGVVIGVPGRVFSHKGSHEVVKHCFPPVTGATEKAASPPGI